MKQLDKYAKIETAAQPSGTFVEVRHPRTLRLLARYNPTTHEIELIDSRRERCVVDLKSYKAPA